MGERTSHTPGTFSWADLATNDPDTAKRFYGELFGWEYDDQPMPGDAGDYSMAQRDGKTVAALYTAREDQPSAWASYVTVESADAAAAKAGDAGGTVLGEPFDVMDAGRMALIQDPTGAFVAAWEPHGNIGAELVNVPGSLTMNQLNTPDPDKAAAFYEALFGWTTERVADEPAFWAFHNGDRLNGGMMELPPGQGAPPHWLVYFACEDVDTDVERIRQLGGQVLVEPTDVPGGRFLVAQDPTGGAFGIFSGEFDD